MKDSQSSFANRFVTIKHGQQTAWHDPKYGWNAEGSGY
jgi:hypothetical protein